MKPNKGEENIQSQKRLCLPFSKFSLGFLTISNRLV
jgi:hypothetical protein